MLASNFRVESVWLGVCCAKESRAICICVWHEPDPAIWNGSEEAPKKGGVRSGCVTEKATTVHGDHVSAVDMLTLASPLKHLAPPAQ